MLQSRRVLQSSATGAATGVAEFFKTRNAKDTPVDTHASVDTHTHASLDTHTHPSVDTRAHRGYR